MSNKIDKSLAKLTIKGEMTQILKIGNKGRDITTDVTEIWIFRDHYEQLHAN